MLKARKLLPGCRFVDASCAWSAGLAGGRDVLAAVRAHRDAFLVQVVVSAVQQAVDPLPQDGGAGALEHGMQLVTNLWALTCGLVALDTYTSYCCRCAWPQPGSGDAWHATLPCRPSCHGVPLAAAAFHAVALRSRVPFVPSQPGQA